MEQESEKMSSKQQIEKDREKIMELYETVREETRNYELAIEALLLANKYLNKADNQRMELALKCELIHCKDCVFYQPYNEAEPFDCYWGMNGATQNDFCSRAERKEK